MEGNDAVDALRILAVVVPVLFSGPSCASRAAHPSAETCLEEGTRLFEQAEWEDANEWVEQARALYPDDLGLALLEFDLWFAQSRFRQALVGIDAARAVHGDLPEIFDRRVAALRQLRRFSEVLAILDAAVADGEEGDELDLLYERGEILAELGRREEALAVFRGILVADPANWRALVACSAMVLASGDAEELAATEALLRGVPSPAAEFPDVLLARALLAERRERDEDAENLYREILSRDPRRLDALQNYALLLERSGRLRQAIQYLEDARGLVAGRDAELESRLERHLEELAEMAAASQVHEP